MSEPIAFEQHRAWFLRNRDSNTDLTFIVERISDGERVGQVAIYGINTSEGTAEIGRFITAPEYQGQGYLREACLQLIQFAFTLLNLSRLDLEVFPDNARALRLYYSLGFTTATTRDGMVHMLLSRGDFSAGDIRQAPAS